MLAELPFEKEHIAEVHDAVSASSANGYDEEYMMTDLFREPGSGVGDDRISDMARSAKRKAMERAGVATRAAREYGTPLKSLIEEHLKDRQTKSGRPLTKSDGTVITADEYLAALESSDIQIYWPYSEDWDGTGYPVITFDPDDGGSTNSGYRLVVDEDGNRSVEEVIVDEEMAKSQPVWVVNRNSDEGHLSLDMIRKLYPGWTLEGGEIVINPSKASGTKTGTSGEISGKSLTLQDFTMYRNYDTWFAGASEFFIKCGAVENFTASTEAELQLYSPSITDFMIVVKRSQVGETLPFKVVLFSDWTGQVENCAFMIIEDDGGKQTSWKCTAVVKIASKSYGFEVDLPFRTRDDIVWRGSLSSRYLEAHSNTPENFGDVVITFEIEETAAI